MNWTFSSWLFASKHNRLLISFKCIKSVEWIDADGAEIKRKQICIKEKDQIWVLLYHVTHNTSTSTIDWWWIPDKKNEEGDKIWMKINCVFKLAFMFISTYANSNVLKEYY